MRQPRHIRNQGNDEERTFEDGRGHIPVRRPFLHEMDKSGERPETGPAVQQDKNRKGQQVQVLRHLRRPRKGMAQQAGVSGLRPVDMKNRTENIMKKLKPTPKKRGFFYCSYILNCFIFFLFLN
jgi:hypothetical protein